MYPVIVDPKKIAEENAALYERSGRHVFESAMERWMKENPRELCRYCGARGSYVRGKDGKRRPWDPADYSEKDGDVFFPTCGHCNGHGSFPVTKARAEYLKKLALRTARKEFRKIRDAVCADRDFTAEEFTALARKRLPKGETTPAAWVAAARKVAELFGTEVGRVA